MSTPGGTTSTRAPEAARGQDVARGLGRRQDEVGAVEAELLLGGERVGERGVGGARLALGRAGDLVDQPPGGAGERGAAAPGRAQVDDVVLLALELAADGAAEQVSTFSGRVAFTTTGTRSIRVFMKRSWNGMVPARIVKTSTA